MNTTTASEPTTPCTTDTRTDAEARALADELARTKTNLRAARRKLHRAMDLLDRQRRRIDTTAREVGTARNPEPAERLDLLAAEAQLEPLADAVAEAEAEVRAARSACLAVIERIEQPGTVERVIADLARLWACRCGHQYPAPSFESFSRELLSDHLRALGEQATEDPAALTARLRETLTAHRI